MKFADYTPLFEDVKELALDDWRPYSVAWVLQRYMEEMDGVGGVAGVKPLGSTKRFWIKAACKMWIGARDARKLTKSDILEHAKRRKAEGVIPATVNQDLTYLQVALAYAASAWDDCEDVKFGAIKAAKPLLKANGLIGKSSPRKRMPTEEEIDKLVAYFTERDARPGVKVKMVPIVLFALASTRRRGEICRLQWGDIDWDKKDDAGNPTPMYMIRDVKHPTRKLGNHKTFPLFPELATIIKAQPRLTDDPTERVFKAVPVTVTALYVEAKHDLDIPDLRFHDSRRYSITKWLKVFTPYQVRQISGHETTVILERVYSAPNPAELHAKLPASV